MAATSGDNPRTRSVPISTNISHSRASRTLTVLGIGQKRLRSGSETHSPSIPVHAQENSSSQPSRTLTVFGIGQNRPPSSSEAHSIPPSASSIRQRYTFPELVEDLIGRGISYATSPVVSFDVTVDRRRVHDTVLVEDRHDHIPHVQVEGRKVWKLFDSHTAALIKDLQRFQDAVHELGSSLDLARSARNIRDYLSVIQWMVRENARKLFPKTVDSTQPPQVTAEGDQRFGQRRPRSWPPASASESHVDHYSETKPIYAILKELAGSVENFRGALVQFPEFDNFGNFSLLCFEGDLNYWSSCLAGYDGQLETREVQTYIHDLSRELGEQFDEISRCLQDYIACAPTVRLSQKHAMSNLQNLATVATFFSAVTATTVQYSFGNNNTPVSRAVNVFWFSSLVFSIASALNSFLVLTWRRATYSSPQLRVPWWLWIWIRQCAPIFLLISVVTFLTGLGCFVISSSQSSLTCIVVLICEGISAFGLAALLVWLAADKWSFYRLQRQRDGPTPGLSRIFTEKPGSVLPTHIEHTASWSAWYIQRAARIFSSLPHHFTACFCSASQPGPPIALKEHSTAPDPSPGPPSGTPTRRSLSLPLAQQRWRRAIKNVISVLRERQDEIARDLLESRRITEQQPSLRQLSVFKELGQHEAGAATSGMQFNPTGSQLVICGKRLSTRYEIGTSMKHQHRHHIGQARQVIWSSSGDYVLTRTPRAIHVYTLAGDTDHHTIIRYETSSFILAIPDHHTNKLPRFVSVEGRKLNKLALIDMRGEEQWNHCFEDISIEHADVVPDGSWVLLAAINPQSSEGFRPMKASPARKLIAFNLTSRQIEHEVPLWHSVQHVTVSRNGRLAIVTYSSYPPPQLWRLHNTPSGVRLCFERQFCARERLSTLEFDPQQPIEFSGSAHFLSDDRFVFCITKQGNIHFWRRDKSDPVHVLTMSGDGHEKPVQVECNPGSNGFTFATRSQNGDVRIWNAPDMAPQVHRVEIEGLRVNVSGLGNGLDNDSRVFSESPLTAPERDLG